MLLEFFGKECPHCVKMHSIIDQLEKEENVIIEKLEVWHNEENQKKMEEEFGEKIKNSCGGFLGVPTFVNSETGKVICGETTLEELKEWIK